jgi:hypothetical protein
VNVLGHGYVAERVRPGDLAHTFGALLPDLASMARVRLEAGASRASPLAAGIRCHHAADAAFHSHAAFVTGAAAVRRELLAAGLPTGPARAVAHAGYELLLDATLVGGEAGDAYRRAFARHATADATLAVLRSGDHARWRAFVAAHDSRGMPRPAHGVGSGIDVEEIADRLVAILRHRPRLALAAADAPLVVAALARRVEDVRGSAPGLLASVVDATFASCGGG